MTSPVCIEWSACSFNVMSAGTRFALVADGVGGSGLDAASFWCIECVTLEAAACRDGYSSVYLQLAYADHVVCSRKAPSFLVDRVDLGRLRCFGEDFGSARFCKLKRATLPRNYASSS